jgi:PAS domain S-box-containing protein
MNRTNKEHYFLAGGGEMGELIRAKDWSKTALGDPETWPPSLCTMVAVMLNNPFGMYIAWGDNYTQLYNDAYRPILGSTKHPDALGSSTKQTFSEIWDIIGPMFAGVMEGKPVGFTDFMLPLNRNGFIEECYFDFSYSPIRKEDGTVGGVLVTVIETTETIRDITDEKKHQDELEQQVTARTKELSLMNESLQKSEERYHLMVEEVQDYAILYLNHEGIVENWNLGAEKIKGYKAEEIIGKNFSTFYTESDRESNLPQKLLNIAIEKGKATQEGWRVRKDGSLFWASVVITAVHNKKGQVIGFSKVTHDLTEKKKADDKLKLNALELEQKNAELEKMNQELQSFAYISSHDLQEPLRKIQTFASQILEKEFENLSDNGKDKFQRMQNAAKRMQTLINDLLSYSRTNIQERIFKKTDLSKIVEEVKEDLKEEIEQKNAIIENCENCEANIIPFQFRQLLYNLISNSLKFSNPETPIVIKISSKIVKNEALENKKLEKDTNYCHIQIKDNGIGFEQQYSSKIFEVFQRLHGKLEYTGTGIGLAIVKKIVDNHNGIITATGEKNKGATFDIYIPVR